MGHRQSKDGGFGDGTGVDDLRVSGPISAQKIIHVEMDEKQEFHGLPEYWRKILGVDKEKSHQEFKAERTGKDKKLMPTKATKKILYYVKKIKSSTLVVSNPISSEHEIHVEVDPQSNTGFKGLPPDLEHLLLESNFTKTEVVKNPEEVFNAVSYADLLQKEETPTLEKRKFPSNEEVNKRLKQNFKLKRFDPIEEYQVIKKIGAGGYGSIFLCNGKIDRKNVFAMKVVKPADSEETHYILSEIAMMQIMKHPNIVPLVDAYYFKAHYFMILEFMDFGDLTKLIQHKWGTIPQDIMAYIIQQSLLGLKELHDSHRLHRDLKSDNILISMNGDIKLADFGYIAQLTEQRQKRNTQVGTACWMAPEVIRKEDYDDKSDIWSMGITLYEMTNKDPPYLGQKKARAFYAILVNDPPCPEPRQKWSPELIDFAEQCLKKDASERLSAAELLEHPFMKKIKSSTIGDFQKFLTFE